MKKILIILMTFIFFSLCMHFKFLRKKTVLILPNHIVCSFHDYFADRRKAVIADVIEKTFKQGSLPEEIVSVINQDFHEVDSIRMQICDSDKICFHVDAAKPLFRLNCAWAVCDTGVQVDASFFDSNMIEQLPIVQTKADFNVSDIISFIEKFDYAILKNFLVDWTNKNHIQLIDKENSAFMLLVSADTAISETDIALCKRIDAQAEFNKLKNKKTRMYDLRFMNQIIMR